MRFLFILLIVILVIWFVKSLRRTTAAAPPQGDEKPEGQQVMLACAHCGLHLPRDEALPGRGGVFCGESHRSAYEQAHPDE